MRQIKLPGIEIMPIKQVNRHIFNMRNQIELHKELIIKYGGDYMWRDKQIQFNRKIDYYNRSLYHLKIRRNILMNEILETERVNAFHKRRDIVGPKMAPKR